MKKQILLISLAVLLFACTNKDKKESVSVSSPDGKNTIILNLNNGKANYAVNHEEIKVILPSKLGFVFKNNDSLASNLEVLEVQKTVFDKTWHQVWGEKQSIRNNYNQLVVKLQDKGESKRKLEVQLRAFNDGVAFRYAYPEQGENDLVIMDELTEFNVAQDGQTWWIPAYKTNRYEHLYTKSTLSNIDTVHTPLTIKSNSNLYLSFHEANLKDYASYTFAHKEGTSFEVDLMPWSNGDKVRLKGSFTTPWRTIQIAENPGDLIESYIILNLNEPNKIEDTSWIETYKYLGIWWGMHISKYTFWEGPKHGASTKISKEYIDACKELGVHHLLIEGWNKGWTDAWYLNKMHEFSFTDATDDFNLKEVTDYAKENDVKIIGYHETGSNIISYRKQIDAGKRFQGNSGCF